MNINFLKDTLNKNHKNLDHFKIFYNFNNINEIFLPNVIFNIEDQFIISGNSKIINKNYYPGILSQISNHVPGSGIFNGDNELLVTESITGEGLSLIIDYSLTGKYTLNQIKITGAGTQNVNGVYDVLHSNYVDVDFNENPIAVSQNSNSFINKVTDSGYFIYNQNGACYANSLIRETGWRVEDHDVGLNPLPILSLYYKNNIHSKLRVLSEINGSGTNNEFNLKLMLTSNDNIIIKFSGQYIENGIKTEIFNAFLNNPVSEKSIASVLMNNNNITLNYHNIYNDILYSQNIICSGNYNNTNKVIKFCKKENDNILGFSGIINNILIFDEDISAQTCQDLALNAIKTGEIETNTTEYITKNNIIKSGFLNPTGVLNRITGYQNITQEYIGNNYYLGLTIPYYIEITGEKLDFKYQELQQQENKHYLMKQSLYDLKLKEKYKNINLKSIGLDLEYPVNLISI